MDLAISSQCPDEPAVPEILQHGDAEDERLPPGREVSRLPPVDHTLAATTARSAPSASKTEKKLSGPRGIYGSFS